MLPSEAIHARLDADPSDSAARLLLAELCDEHGDAEQARGLRWLAERHKWPCPFPDWNDVNHWVWWVGLHRPHHNVGQELAEKAQAYYLTRRAAESALCAALAATGEGE